MTELSEIAVKEMISLARQASRHAYCPYSGFHVGACVLTKDGRYFSGCNVENASYGLTTCAERGAIFQAIAQGAKEFRAIVIYTATAEPALSCGACRQVINEFGTDIEVISVCDGPDSIRRKISELLPEPFGADSIG